MNVKPLKIALMAAALLGFIALHVTFLAQILRAHGAPPDLDTVWVNIAATLSGVLGAAFAVAMGVKDSLNGSGLRTLRVSGTDVILTIGIWVYAVFGVVSVVVYATNSDETPGSVSSLALIFIGYVAALLSNAYKAVLTG